MITAQPAIMSMEYHIRQYGLQQGALEIQYIEEFFGEFSRRKTSAEVVARLSSRDHQIVMAEAVLPADPDTVAPVAYKVSHELRASETDPKLADLVTRLSDCVAFEDRKILYSWIGGTRRDWRGQGFFRALTEQQEAWALDNGFDEVLVKTKKPTLRHAWHARPPGVQRHQVRARRRRPAASRRCISASGSVEPCSTGTAARAPS